MFLDGQFEAMLADGSHIDCRIEVVEAVDSNEDTYLVVLVVGASFEMAEYVCFVSDGEHHNLETQRMRGQQCQLWTLVSSWMRACTHRPHSVVFWKSCSEAENVTLAVVVECTDGDAVAFD